MLLKDWKWENDKITFVYTIGAFVYTIFWGDGGQRLRLPFFFQPAPCLRSSHRLHNNFFLIFRLCFRAERTRDGIHFMYMIPLRTALFIQFIQTGLKGLLHLHQLGVVKPHPRHFTTPIRRRFPQQFFLKDSLT